MTVTVGETSWEGFTAWVLETDALRAVVVPHLGAKLVSLVDKRVQLEWLVGPGDRPLKKVSYGAPFEKQDMSGWDEMFPTIVACEYPAPGENSGRPLPDHGEVWTLPWRLENAGPDRLSLSVEGRALPYRLTRTLSFGAPNELVMQYELENRSQEAMPYVWAAHPQFVCGDEAEVRLPSGVTEVCNTLPAGWGWGEPETRFAWPEYLGTDGQPIRINRTGPASLEQARKFFVLPETRIGWATLMRRPSKDWLRLDWDPNSVPYFGLWVDEGALNHETVVALEPTTGFYDSLALAWKKGEVTAVAPDSTTSWRLRVRVGTGEHPFAVHNGGRAPVDTRSAQPDAR
jgi:galactose mutarotase-like enzyme